MTIGTLGIFSLGLSEAVAFNAITDGKDELVVRMNSELQEVPLDLSAKVGFLSKEEPLNLSTKERHEMLGPIRKQRPIRSFLIPPLRNIVPNQGMSRCHASSERLSNEEFLRRIIQERNGKTIGDYVRTLSWEKLPLCLSRRGSMLRYIDQTNNVRFKCPFNDGLIFGIVFLIYYSDPKSTILRELLPLGLRSSLNVDDLCYVSSNFMSYFTSLSTKVDNAIRKTRRFLDIP